MIWRRRQRGDSLIEVTIAMAIIASVIASSVNLANSSFRLGQIARQRTEASGIMQAEAEALRNQRDATLSSGEAGWKGFVQSYTGATALIGLNTVTSCTGSPVPTPYYGVVQPTASILSPTGGDTWAPSTGTPTPTPPTSQYATGTNKYLTVKTQQATYSTWVQVCSLDAFDRLASTGYSAYTRGGTDNDTHDSFDLRFTVFLQWQTPNGQAQTASLVTELADVAQINQQVPVIDNTPLPSSNVAPSITSFTAFGTVESYFVLPPNNAVADGKMYDSSQCDITATPMRCTQIELQWTSIGNPTPTCIITQTVGPNAPLHTYGSVASPLSASNIQLADPLDSTTPLGGNVTSTYVLNCKNFIGSAVQAVSMRVISCQPPTDPGGVRKGYGFQFKPGWKQCPAL